MAEADKLLSTIRKQGDKLERCKQLFEGFIHALHDTRIDDAWFQLEEDEPHLYDFDIPGAAAYVRLLWHGPSEIAQIVYGFIHKAPGEESREYKSVCYFKLAYDGTVENGVKIDGYDAPKLIHLTAVERLCRSIVPDCGELLELPAIR